jgi:hypothetical protein
MGKKAQQFLQVRRVVTLIALDPLRSKETGNQTLIRQIIYLAANGSAVGVNL